MSAKESSPTVTINVALLPPVTRMGFPVPLQSGSTPLKVRNILSPKRMVSFISPILILVIIENIEVKIFQSNHEGDLVDFIQRAYFEKADGIVINPGAYTHTSVALLDAVKSARVPTVEVHISKVEEREDFRQISYIRLACIKTITGEGFRGYLHGIDHLAAELGK